MLLEEARLRCRSLLDYSDGVCDGPDGHGLQGLYGELGAAGYHVSARLDPARRRQLLAQAHARAVSHGAGEGPIRALADVTAAAIRTVERALTMTGLLDHMQVAHFHVMSAGEALDAMFALPA